MLNKARRQFIIWAMIAMIVIVVVLIAAVNIVNRNLTDRRLDAVIDEIVHTRPAQGTGSEKETIFFGPEGEEGTKPLRTEGAEQATGSGEFPGTEMQGKKTGDKGQMFEKGPGGRSSAMLQYGNRYFITGVNDEGEMTELSRQQEIVSEEEAARLAQLVLQSGSTKGYVEEYKYLVFDRDDGRAICFLDCSVNFSSLNALLLISILVGAAGIILGFLFILVMSRKTVEPVRISIEKQKQFITNAGHELKTPLSAIATNMDILEMDLGENEWVSGTKKQVRKLRRLVENLVSLSKMEEEDNDLEFQYFCLSDVAEECVGGFDSIAAMQGRELHASIEPGLSTSGDPSMVQQLLSILCDNAVKYAVGTAPVEVRLYKDGRNICFETANDWAHNVDDDKLDSLFERFYRGDPSRDPDNKSSGHGLGLSIAKAMAEKNRARLTVSTDSAGRIIFRAVFRSIEK